ncbi:MAG: hypothetical protein MJ215_03935 [Spirochaetia bacterium]|nr:hypothetical protein [Spirochaetia bacterium]
MENRLKVSTFLRFWLPLAIMQIIINFEFPLAIAFISRAGDIKENLAIFTVVTSLSLLLEGPIIQFLSAATALADSWNNYLRLKHFLLAFLAILTGIHAACALPGPFHFISTRIMKLEPEYIAPARTAFLLMIPWVPTIGLRRMWQGVMIRAGHTIAVSFVTLIRIVVTLSVLILMLNLSSIRGCYAASIALSLGVFSGALSAYLLALPTLRKQKHEYDSSETRSLKKTIGWKELILFYLPLALTSFVTEADRPIIAAGISRGLLPMESLALWSVIISLVAIFRGICTSTQEASIALFSTRENNRILMHSVMGIGVAACVICFSWAFIPPVREYIFITLSGLPQNLADMAAAPFMLITPVLLSFPIIAWLRAVNINSKTTRNIGFSVAMNLAAVFLAITVMNTCFTMKGITIAVISYIIAMYAEAGYLMLRTQRTKF